MFGSRHPTFFVRTTRVLCLGILLAGLGILALGGRDLYFAFTSHGWPTVSGTVISAGLERKEGMKAVGRKRRPSTYRALVSYRYVLNGVKYKGNIIYFGYRGTKRSSDAAKILQEYPVGRQILVHYDPSEPSRAVLEPGPGADSWRFLGWGLALVAASQIGVILKPRRRCKN